MNNGSGNKNSPPRLSGGNTIAQAIKPSKAPVSIPSSPITISQADYDSLRDENERLRHEKLKLEDQLRLVCNRLHEAKQTIETLRRSSRRMAFRASISNSKVTVTRNE